MKFILKLKYLHLFKNMYVFLIKDHLKNTCVFLEEFKVRNIKFFFDLEKKRKTHVLVYLKKFQHKFLTLLLGLRLL